MGFAEDISNATRRAMCAWSKLGNAFGDSFPGGQSPFGKALEYWTCDIPPENSDGGVVTVGQPALPNGQCVGSYYRVEGNWSIQNIASGNIETNTFSLGGSVTNRIYGPIRGLGYKVENGITIGFFIKGSTIAGAPFDYVSQGREAPPGTKFLNANISNITYLGGNGDDCGGKPEEPPEYDDIIPDPDGGPDININLRPSVPIFLPGAVTLFPVTIEGPNFTLNVNYNPNNGGCDPVEPDFGDEDDSESIGGEPIPEVGENEPPEPPEGENEGFIIGCIVSVTGRTDSVATVIGGTTGFPELLIPRVADISFAVIVDGKTAWTADIPVKFDKQWIPVPGRLLAYDVRIKPEPGVNALYFPLRVTQKFKDSAGFL